MVTFLVLCGLGVVGCIVVGSVLSALIHALFWIVTLPFRIVFKLLFSAGGLILGLIVSAFFFITPLLPVLLLGAFGWAVFRLGARRPAAPPPPPHPGFWS